MEKTISITVWVVIALVIGAILGAVIMPSKVETIASQCQACPAIPALSCPDPVINVQDVNTDWKQTAVDMASAEWSEKGYKPIFEVLRHIDEKEDISSVVVKYTKVEDSDSFSRDAVVIQKLKVYYEDDKGDNKKAYVDATTTIRNGEIEDIKINLK